MTHVDGAAIYSYSPLCHPFTVALGPSDDSNSTPLLNKVKYKNLVKKSFRTWSNVKAIHVSSDFECSECGRGVLTRAQSAVTEMRKRAVEPPSLSCVTVSHSSFLRAMLSVLQGEDLASMFGVKQVNGCINYVEVEMEGDGWFYEDPEDGGEELDGSADWEDEDIKKNVELMRGLKIRSKVLRVNDAKHLSRGFRDGVGGGRVFRLIR
jgi:hypothetical protein